MKKLGFKNTFKTSPPRESTQTPPNKREIPLPFDPLLRLPQVLSILPISKSSFWKMVSEGRAPKGIKLGSKTTCWRLSDIRKLVEKTNETNEEHSL